MIEDVAGFPTRETLMISPKTYVDNKEGLDVYPYDLKDEEDVRKPILGYIHSGNEIKFEEVIYIDPENQFVATYEGSELTYDYCIISTGKLPDYSKIEGLKEGLLDEFSFVVSTFDYKNAKKML